MHQVGGGAGEAGAQLLALGGDADGAVVGVAHARHDAAGRDHGHRAKAVLVAAQRSHQHHVAPVAHAAVHPQHHTLAQLVLRQALRASITPLSQAPFHLLRQHQTHL